jgi:hypothetical protein
MLCVRFLEVSVKRREVIRKLGGCAAAAAAGPALAGNIPSAQRLYGVPATLSFRRRREESLLYLALAREEIPTGVLEETSALARLALDLVLDPSKAHAFAADPNAAFQALGYDASALRLDAPELRPWLVLADPEVRAAVAVGDASAFLNAVRAFGVEPCLEQSRLSVAFCEAVAQDAALGIRLVGPNDPSDLPTTTACTVATVYCLVAVLVGVAVAVAAWAYVGVWVSVVVSGGGGGGGGLPRRGGDRLSLEAVALLGANPGFARQVRDMQLEQNAQRLTETVLEVAAASGVSLGRDQAENYVRTAVGRLFR